MTWRAILAATLLSGGLAVAGPAGALAQALPTDRSELAYSLRRWSRRCRRRW